MNLEGKVKHVFILGTPFSGSTLLTNTLDVHPEVFAVGEFERLPKFKRFEHLIGQEPDIYDDACFLCRAFDRACPIWHDASRNAIASHGNVFESHRYLAHLAHEHLNKSPRVVIDSSKTPDWFRYSARTLAGANIGYRTVKDEDVCAIITTKSVFGFAESMMRRSGMSPILVGQMWCDVTTDALRVVAAMSVPSIIIRYEDISQNWRLLLQRLLRFLSLPADDQIVAGLIAAPESNSHAIGGNAFAYKNVLGDRLSSIDVRSSWESLRAQYIRGDAVGERRWICELSEATVDLIASTRGVHDLSQQLGYDLNFEIKLFHKGRTKA